MDKKEMIKYIEYVLMNNSFLEHEVTYYRGESKSSKNPHSIDKKLWNSVANNIGFKLNKLDRLGKYYVMKDNK